MNLSFYPGPSKIYPQIKAFMLEACDSGILSANHRSSAFEELMASTTKVVKEKLQIPDNYSLMFCSSATECWEIIAQSWTKKGSLHLYQGEFGKKWCEYAAKIARNVQGLEILPDFELRNSSIEPDVFCLTHNETSNGTCLQYNFLQQVKNHTDKYFPNTLIALDATSSMAGLALPFSLGDIWFASVQKCFGLPAGLAVLVCSPKAIEKAKAINDQKYYNSLLFMHQNMLKNQTPYTPNVLNIWLLNKIMNLVQPIANIDKHLQTRAADVYNFMATQGYKTLISKQLAKELLLSPTVLAFGGEPNFIVKFKEKLQAHQIVVGNGYGKWQATSFRIANFPAITDEDFEKLKEVIKTFHK
jgi:phosphoserine aminotransferase